MYWAGGALVALFPSSNGSEEITFHPATWAKANRLSISVRFRKALRFPSTEPPPTRRLRRPRFWNKVTSCVLVAEKRFPDTPCRLGRWLPVSKLSPLKSSGTAKPRLLATVNTTGDCARALPARQQMAISQETDC